MRRAVIAVMTAQILGVIIGIAVLTALAHQALLPAPFAYTDAAFQPIAAPVAVYEAEQPRLCAGQPLVFTIYLRVTEIPSVISPYAKIMDRRTMRAVRGTFGLLNPPPPYASPVHVSARLHIPTPVSLSPGPYAFEVVAVAEGRASSGFRVLFQIADCSGGAR